MFPTFVYALHEIVNGLSEGIGRESQLGLGLWQLVVVSLELGLFIIFTGCKTPMKIFRLCFLGLGISSIFFGVCLISRRFLIQFYNKDPFYLEREPYDAISINFMGLAVNIITMLVFCICGWGNLQEVEEDEEKNLFWNFNVYSDWVFKCLSINSVLCTATILSTQIYQLTIPDPAMALLLGIFFVVFGISTFKYYIKNNFDFIDDILNDEYVSVQV